LYNKFKCDYVFKIHLNEKPINNLNSKMGYLELRRKYELLEDLMEHSPDVIYFKDRTGRLVMVNQMHAKGLGLKPEQVVGKTDFDFFPKERAEKMLKDDMEVIKTGKPIIDKVERATRPDGIDNYVSTTKIPRYDNKGNIIGLIGITRDITRRMQLEHLRHDKANIEKKIETLEELNRMKSDVISVVSHELRTPLAIIKEAILLILDEVYAPINEKQNKVLTSAKDNVERLRKIIEDLLDMSRFESKEFKLRYSLVNLNSLLKESSEFFKKIAQEKGIALEYKLPKKPINIFLDFDRINQVISNLLNNAIKFTERGGKITVELKILEGKIRIRILDTGVGIAKQDISKLFNKFVQVSKVKGAERKGVGLGLSIVKDLIEKHAGDIWLESKLGVGSKFYFTLPLLYTTSDLDKEAKQKIDKYLDENVPLYLINILVIDYLNFRKRIKVVSGQVFSDLIEIIKKTLERLSKDESKRPQLVFADARQGECGVIYPFAKNEEEAIRLCQILKNEIVNYVTINKIKGVFINTEILSFSKDKGRGKQKFAQGNLHIKRVYIGSEVRHSERIDQKLGMEVIFSQKSKEPFQTIDISQGGLCFIGTKHLKINSQIEIRLNLPGQKEPLYADGRVAWVKDVADSPGSADTKYKVGLEFSRIRDKEKKKLARFLNSISGLLK
jgi:PAS domain S-box-containing protein